MLRRSLTVALTAMTAPIAGRAQTPEPPLDQAAQAAIRQIRDEASQRSQVMDIASWMTDVYGPRLTGSPGLKAASDWAVKTLAAWGLANARQEVWGTLPFPDWYNDVAMARVVAPRPFQVYVGASLWGVSTPGVVRGEVVLLDTVSAAQLEAFRGKLKGKFVFISHESVMKSPFRMLGHRLTDEELATLANGSAAVRPLPPPAGPFAPPPRPAKPEFHLEGDSAAVRFFEREGVLAVVQTTAGSYGTMFGAGGCQSPKTLPCVGFAAEHYGRIYRTVQKGVPVTLELQVQNTFAAATPSTNILAEIPGGDPKLRDEVVMLGAHFDDAALATGATDNAAGCAVMMEAMRILQTLHLPMKRTVRLGLWTGEEEGNLGSRGYVAQQFGGADDRPATPAHAKFSAYYNLDNGTGAIRGVYLQGNQDVEPIFRSWMEPFKDLGMATLSLQGTYGTDHETFDGAGLPGFQFIQDSIEYQTRTHHSNMDTYERLQEEDLRKNAAIVAAFVYLTANRAEKLPRKK